MRTFSVVSFVVILAGVKGVCPSTSRIPIVSLNESDMPRDEAAVTFDRALSAFGCVVVTGHALDPDLINHLREEAHKFFSLPIHAKMKYFSGGYGGFGYSPVFTEAVDASSGSEKTPDKVESFYMNSEFVSTEDLRSFLDAIVSYRSALQRMVVLPTLRLAAEALGLNNRQAFITANDAHDRDLFGVLKLSRYPPEMDEKNITANRYGPHSDWEGFTFLLPDEQDDDRNGLEVFYEGSWLFVGPVPSNAFIVNAADFVPLWTDGHWKSPIHRVRTLDRTRDRLAAPFFVGPAATTEVHSLFNSETDGVPLKAGQWLEAKLSRVQI